MPLYMGCDVSNQACIERGPQEPEVSPKGTDRGRGSFRDDDRVGTMGYYTRPFLMLRGASEADLHTMNY